MAHPSDRLRASDRLSRAQKKPENLEMPVADLDKWAQGFRMLTLDDKEITGNEIAVDENES